MSKLPAKPGVRGFIVWRQTGWETAFEDFIRVGVVQARSAAEALALARALCAAPVVEEAL